MGKAAKDEAGMDGGPSTLPFAIGANFASEDITTTDTQTCRKHDL